MNTNLLEVNNIVKTFSGFTALSGVTFQVQPEEILALIGPNGAGKTTCYNILSGRLKPTHGEVLFHGQRITGLSPDRISRLGIGRSFQVSNVFDELTVLENVLVALVAKEKKGLRFFSRVEKDGELNRKGLEILRDLGLEDLAPERAATLSYGDKRLIEFAIVLAGDPELLLLDEPTAGMTPEETKRTTHLIQRLSSEKKLTIFLTEHDMDVVFDLAKRILVLQHGAFLAQGRPEEIRENPQVRMAYLGEEEDSDA